MIDHPQDQLPLRGMDPLQGRKLFVRKRDARIEEFNEARIALAIESAFKAVEGAGRDAVLPGNLQAAVKRCADAVADRVMGRAIRGEQLEVERIQDEVEDQLMLDGHLAVARRYILYREQRRLARAQREGRLSSALNLPPKPVAPVKSPPPVVPITSAGPRALLLEKIYSQALSQAQPGGDAAAWHRRNFSLYINEGQYLNHLPEEMADFDLPLLAEALRVERDELFPVSGLQALHDEYLLEDNGRRIETPQYFWMRLAMGLALNEGEQRNARAVDFYDALSTFRFVPSETILGHAGTIQPQLLNCFSVTDWSDLEHVTAKLGPRLERRKKSGLTCSWLEPWHRGIRDFLQRPVVQDSSWRQDLNKGLWVPDLFMKRIGQKGQWTLFDPGDAPDLHRKFGRAFEEAYLACEERADRGEIKNFQRVHAADLWQEILASMAETGQPWLGFKDAVNLRSAQDHAGAVRHASLCAALLLNATPASPAACSVGSINLAAHLTSDAAIGLDAPLLRATIETAMRMLDNAIDIDCGPGSREHRPVALGLLGFQDALDRLETNYASAAAAAFADRTMELISHGAILASTALARERGVYPGYEGSKWSHGLLPVDTIGLLSAERGAPIDLDLSTSLDWDLVREAIARHGMRHGATTGISTTEAGSKITGASLSVEPARQLKQGKEGAPLDVEPQWLIECAARRQKWLDMGQSLGLYAATPDLAVLADVYMQAWEKGLKTTRQLYSPAHPLPASAPETWPDPGNPRHSPAEPVAAK